MLGHWGFDLNQNPIRKIVALAFNRVRMSLVFLMLAGVSALTGDWREFTGTTIQPLMISGLIGIFLGDTTLFDSLERLDSSRSAVIFALKVPRTVSPRLVSFERTLGALTLLRSDICGGTDCHFNRK